MDNYTLTKYDFKKYLLASLKDARQEDLILWKKNIPLPVDLVHRIFDEGETLVINYCHHIVGISIICQYYVDNDIDLSSLDNFPCQEALEEIIDVQELYDKYSESVKSIKLLQGIGNVLNLEIPAPTFNEFISTISHEGRKYKRLYVPKSLKNAISYSQPELLMHIGVSNGDMFGNVVADYLKIYRSGFSDAFAAIFNKLLDFFIDFSEALLDSESKKSRIEIKQIKDKKEGQTTILERISDGALWEPRYINSGTVTVVNEAHPYYGKVNEKNAQELLFDITSKLSEMENNSVKDSERRLYEMIRFELSRHLRLKSDC